MEKQVLVNLINNKTPIARHTFHQVVAGSHCCTRSTACDQNAYMQHANSLSTASKALGKPLTSSPITSRYCNGSCLSLKTQQSAI